MSVRALSEDMVLSNSINYIAWKIFLLTLAICVSGCLAEQWKRAMFLDRNNRFKVLWSANEHEIVFQIEANAKGYVALGLSQNGAMMGSDIVTGWVANGEVHFQDRHGIGNTMPEVDRSQDWQILYGSENDTHTVLKFKRKLQTCDEEEDLEIKDETIVLIYAYSDVDPPDYRQLQYHSDKRGAKRVLLLQKDILHSTDVSDLLYWDARGTPISVPHHVDSTYWCHILKIPVLAVKHHIVKVELIITPGNEEYVHHMDLLTAEGTGLESSVGSGGFYCKNPPATLPPENKYRHTGIIDGFGSEGIHSPPNAGIPFGNTEYKYYELSIHYENPFHVKGIIDNSGFRLFYTPDVRPNDMGRWFLGLNVNAPFVIPPKRKAYVVAKHDDLRCVAEFMRPEGIKIVGALVHMHVLGRRGSIRHFRQGKELKPILDNVNCDYMYQNVIDFKEEVTVLPGDQITTECVFDSTERNTTTFGGYTSTDEMCIGYMNYYPAFPFHETISGPSRSLMLALLGDTEHHLDNGTQFLMDQDWTKVNVTNFENALRYSPCEVTCKTDHHSVKSGLISYPVNLQTYQRPNSCGNRVNLAQGTGLSRNTIIKASKASKATGHCCFWFQYKILALGMLMILLLQSVS